jgi:hypothetical protein
MYCTICPPFAARMVAVEQINSQITFKALARSTACGELKGQILDEHNTLRATTFFSFSVTGKLHGHS